MNKINLQYMYFSFLHATRFFADQIYIFANFKQYCFSDLKYQGKNCRKNYH